MRKLTHAGKEAKANRRVYSGFAVAQDECRSFVRLGAPDRYLVQHQKIHLMRFQFGACIVKNASISLDARS
ncbi:hypothetical protein D3C86_1407530 [compost metagenome]